MTRRRWIADEVQGDRAMLLGDHAAHLVRVLRARVGQKFDISTNGELRLGTVTEIEPDRVVFALGEELEAATLPEITMLLSVFKFDRMEWAIEKCTELGISAIVPVISRRVDSHLASSAIKRMERWRRIAAQASEQSRRVSPPEIHEPMKLREAIARASVAISGNAPKALCLVLAESEQELALARALESWNGGAIEIAVGPEGGWTEEECVSFANGGWIAASLGPTILRAETAAITAAAIVLSATT
jgi:16S rRNA (uracil1498-N3)-methyltransferase